MANEILVVNDTGRKVEFILQENGLAKDITGATVLLHYRIADGTVKVKTMAIVAPATDGRVEYEFLVGDLDVPGDLDYEVQVTDVGGKITTFRESGSKLHVFDELA